VKTSLSTISTINASFADDVAAYHAAGFDGIGLWEFKLPADDAANLELLSAAGLAVTNCVPTVATFLQLGIPGMEGPDDPAERLEAICASIGRLAAYEPECVVCLAGPLGGRDLDTGRAIVVEGLQAAAAAARGAGVTLALEPAHPSQRESVSFVTSILEAVDVLDEAGTTEVGLLLDTYHVWDDPAVWDFIGRASYRIAGVHVGDWPAEEGRLDRVLPGEGISRTKELVAALALSGWDGYLDVEVFSEPDLFWGLPVDDAARRAHDAVTAVAP
jgi:sugar phosphate isomerase/epimerase